MLFLVLRVFVVDAPQLQVGTGIRKLHAHPAMGVSFPKVIANRRLVDQMDLMPLAEFPFMGMSVKKRLGMFVPIHQLKESLSLSIAHALERTDPLVGQRIEVSKHHRRSVRPKIQLPVQPIELPRRKLPDA